MRIFKVNPILKLANSYVIDSTQPSNLSYAWNFGSLLAVCLIIQIVTGVTLAMHYNSNVVDAFNSVEHIMRDVNNGWLIRYLHANTASAFFFLVYLHIGRGLYYGSYKFPRTLVWTIGTVVLILLMAIAFLGYVLPYGQMSLWGATVITNLMSAIPWVGQDIVEFIWGGFSVNNATLNRFFALHFLLPFALAALVLMHLIVLHDGAGSGNPLGVSSNSDRLPFAPYFIFKDLITIFIFILALSVFVFFMPNVLGDSENYVMANPMQTPPAIVPEWYLLPFYAILRSIPNKLLGVIAMFTAILAILSLSSTDLSRLRGIQFRPLSKVAFFVYLGNFLILMKLGGKHVESPFIEFGLISTILYFSYFFVIVPMISTLENSLKEAEQKKDKNLKLDYMHSSHNDKYKIISVNYSFKTFIFIMFCLYVCLLPNKPNNVIYCDAPRPWGTYFQDSGTPQMEGLVELHDNILFYLVIILFAVMWILVSILKMNTTNGAIIPHKHLGHGTFVELIWTITPALILILITFPSFKLLFLMDEVSDPAMAILAEGHQWYWSYLYADFTNDDYEPIEFDSYLVPESDLVKGGLRMLEVDNRIIIPELTHVRFLVTAADVIHSFACPSLGIKCDAYPGRLNQVSFMLSREGTFFGQCSEICGLLHSGMPVVFESISVDKFVSWLLVSVIPFTNKKRAKVKRPFNYYSYREASTNVTVVATLTISTVLIKKIALGLGIGLISLAIAGGTALNLMTPTETATQAAEAVAELAEAAAISAAETEAAAQAEAEARAQAEAQAANPTIEPLDFQNFLPHTDLHVNEILTHVRDVISAFHAIIPNTFGILRANSDNVINVIRDNSQQLIASLAEFRDYIARNSSSLTHWLSHVNSPFVNAHNVNVYSIGILSHIDLIINLFNSNNLEEIVEDLREAINLLHRDINMLTADTTTALWNILYPNNTLNGLSREQTLMLAPTMSEHLTDFIIDYATVDNPNNRDFAEFAEILWNNVLTKEVIDSHESLVKDKMILDSIIIWAVHSKKANSNMAYKNSWSLITQFISIFKVISKFLVNYIKKTKDKNIINMRKFLYNYKLNLPIIILFYLLIYFYIEYYWRDVLWCDSEFTLIFPAEAPAEVKAVILSHVDRYGTQAMSNIADDTVRKLYTLESIKNNIERCKALGFEPSEALRNFHSLLTESKHNIAQMYDLRIERAKILGSSSVYPETKEISNTMTWAWTDLYGKVLHDKTLSFKDVRFKNIQANENITSISDIVRAQASYENWHRQH